MEWSPRFRIYPDFFYISPDQDKLEKLGGCQDGKGKNLGGCFISLLTSSLLPNGLVSLSDVEATPLELVSGIHKVPFFGCYLPSLMVGLLITVKKYLKLARAYPELPPVVDLKGVTL